MTRAEAAAAGSHDLDKSKTSSKIRPLIVIPLLENITPAGRNRAWIGVCKNCNHNVTSGNFKVDDMRRQAANCSQAPVNCQGSASQTKSKARFRITYSNGIKTPEREGALCPGVVIRCCSRPSTNSPKTAALSGQPCFTHIRHSKMSEMPFWVLTAALS